MDSQQAVSGIGPDMTPKVLGVIVIGAVVALFFLRKLSINVSAG